MGAHKLDITFCRRCGTKLTQQSLPHHYKCENGHDIFVNPSPAVNIILLTDHGTILVGRRAHEPFKGSLDCIGGFMDGGNETAEQAIHREIEEEVGLKPVDYSEPHYVSSDTVSYPFGGEEYPVLVLYFWAKLTKDAKPVAADDVAELIELPISATEADGLPSDDARALAKLRNMYNLEDL